MIPRSAYGPDGTVTPTPAGTVTATPEESREEFFESFRPMPVRGAHCWRLDGGPTLSHGTEAVCKRCGLRLVARIDALGLTLVPVLYHASAPSSLPYLAVRDRCTAPEAT